MAFRNVFAAEKIISPPKKQGSTIVSADMLLFEQLVLFIRFITL